MNTIAVQTNMSAVREALSCLPKSIDTTYEVAMERILAQAATYRDLALQVLAWLSHTQVPFPVEDLQHALAVGAETGGFNEEPTHKDTLLSVCMGLVVVDSASGIIHLVHHTTKKFFEENIQRWVPDGKLQLTKACITYASFALDRKYGLTPSREAPFLALAALRWGHYAHDEVEYIIPEQILNFLNRDFNFPWELYWNDSGLHLAAWFGLEHIVTKLLERNVDINERDKRGDKALHFAVRCGNSAMVSLLLRRGANTKIRSKPSGWAALYRKAAELKLEVRREKGEQTAPEDTGGYTALDEAIEAGHETIVKLLREHEVEPETHVQVLSKTVRALYTAVRQGVEVRVRKLLKETTDVDVRSEEGLTVLQVAVQQGYESIAKLLLERKANTEAHDEDGETPLHKAAANGHDKIIRLLINHAAHIDAKSGSGGTPLHEAASWGHEKAAQLLINEGASVDVRNERGATPMHDAAVEGYDIIVSLLVGEGASVAVKDDLGRTALHMAALGGHGTVARLLIRKGADIEAKDREGQTALHMASMEGSEDVVRSLLKKKADVNTMDEAGNTALHKASSGGHQTVASLLLEYGADIMILNKSRRTALQEASVKGNTAVVELLREKNRAVVRSLLKKGVGVYPRN